VLAGLRPIFLKRSLRFRFMASSQKVSAKHLCSRSIGSLAVQNRLLSQEKILPRLSTGGQNESVFLTVGSCSPFLAMESPFLFAQPAIVAPFNSRSFRYYSDTAPKRDKDGGVTLKNVEKVPSPVPDLEPEEPAKSGLERFKALMNQYGYVAVGTYVSAYVGMLCFTYGLASTGIVPAGDAVKAIEWLGLDIHSLTGGRVGAEEIQNYGPQAGKIFTAWALTKISEPFRLVFTVTITPTIARYLGFAPKKQKPS